MVATFAYNGTKMCSRIVAFRQIHLILCDDLLPSMKYGFLYLKNNISIHILHYGIFPIFWTKKEFSTHEESVSVYYNGKVDLPKYLIDYWSQVFFGRWTIQRRIQKKIHWVYEIMVERWNTAANRRKYFALKHTVWLRTETLYLRRRRLIS